MIYRLRPASGFPVAGLVVLVVSGNLVMPGVDSVRCPVWIVGTAPLWTVSMVAAPGLGAAWHLLALELQIGGKAHRVDAVLLNRFLVTGGEFGVVFIAGARGVVNVI